jgi:hypothetical protein
MIDTNRKKINFNHPYAKIIVSICLLYTMNELKSRTGVIGDPRVSGDQEKSENHITPLQDFFDSMPGYEIVEFLDVDGLRRNDRKEYAKRVLLPRVEEVIQSNKERYDKWAYGWVDFTRIGGRPREVDWYVEELIDRGVSEFWDVQEKSMLDWDSDTGYMKIAINKINSQKELKDKSYRTLKDRKNLIKNNLIPGKISPYGYDFLIINVKDNSVHGREIYVSKERTGEYHISKKTGNPLEYEIYIRHLILPNGTIEEYRDELVYDELLKKKVKRSRPVPMEQYHQKKVLVVNESQRPIVELIHSLAWKPEWKTAYEIHKILKERGIMGRFGKPLDTKDVTTILTGEVYYGYPTDNLNSKCQYTRLTDAKMYYEMTDAEHEAIKIIDKVQWQEVNDHIASHPCGYPIRRRPNLENFWARNLCVCECGMRLNISSQSKSVKTNKTTENYRCIKCGSGLTSVIHKRFDDWIEWMKSKLKESTSYKVDHAKRYNSLLGKNGSVGKCNSTQTLMLKYVLENIGGDDPQESFRQELIKENDNPSIETFTLNLHLNDEYTKVHDNLEAVYIKVFEKVNKVNREAKLRLEQDNRDLWLENRTDIPMSFKKHNAEQVAINDIKIASIDKSLVSLVIQSRKEKEKMLRTAEALAELQDNMRKATGNQKEAILRKYLKKAVLMFGKPIHKNKSRLQSIKFIANDPLIEEKVFDCRALTLEFYKANARRSVWTPERKKAMSELKKAQHRHKKESDENIQEILGREAG